jgi:hypothetical protein
VSFLEVQDLALVAAQADFGRLIGAWFDFDTIFNVLEAAGGAGLIAFVVGRKSRPPH